MLKKFWQQHPKTSGLGLDLRPGDAHYRAYIGPPKDYDLVAAMVFNLLTCTGLRQHHRVLDIGCGSLRVGRLLIPYLNPHRYIGIEPNQWLIEDGIANELGKDLINIKQPQFVFSTSLDSFKQPLNADYAIAQSIFSHCGLDLIQTWLSQLSSHLNPQGALFATFLTDTQDYSGQGWVYPACVNYQTETLKELAVACGFQFQMLDWAHPRQAWAIFAKPQYDMQWIENGAIHWNRVVMKENLK